MKYIKTFDKLTLVKYSNLDSVIDRVKSKLDHDLEKEFSKYLKPTTIILNNKSVKAFLLEPDFGITITIEFNKMPNRTFANICIIQKINDKWKRFSYEKWGKDFNLIRRFSNYHAYDAYNIEDMVENYIDKLKIKNENRLERIFKKDIMKYNL